MKRIVLSLLAAGAIVGSAAPSFAQGPRPGDWQPLAVRQAVLDQRIDQGVRSGQLTRGEAVALRGEFNGLLRLEAQYKAGRFTMDERQDLQRRYDALAQRVRFERRDNDTRYYPAGR